VLCSLQDHLRTRTRNLDHRILVDAENTNSSPARKGDLQHTFPLDIPMVPSLALAVAVDCERLPCDGFSLGETICFDSLSLPPWKDGSDATVMGSYCGGPPSPLWAIIGDSIKEFHMASNGKGGIDLLSPRRHGTGLHRPHHNHIIAGEHSDHSSYGDDSTVTGSATVGH
jgi:hypothetical protein